MFLVIRERIYIYKYIHIIYSSLECVPAGVGCIKGAYVYGTFELHRDVGVRTLKCFFATSGLVPSTLVTAEVSFLDMRAICKFDVHYFAELTRRQSQKTLLDITPR